MTNLGELNNRSRMIDGTDGVAFPVPKNNATVGKIK